MYFEWILCWEFDARLCHLQRQIHSTFEQKKKSIFIEARVKAIEKGSFSAVELARWNILFLICVNLQHLLLQIFLEY